MSGPTGHRDSARMRETYLGDGAYVYLSPMREIVLYTTDGLTVTNIVVLEDFGVLSTFERWLRELREDQEDGNA